MLLGEFAKVLSKESKAEINIYIKREVPFSSTFELSKIFRYSVEDFLNMLENDPLEYAVVRHIIFEYTQIKILCER